MVHKSNERSGIDGIFFRYWTDEKVSAFIKQGAYLNCRERTLSQLIADTKRVLKFLEALADFLHENPQHEGHIGIEEDG